jgi:hypothetical protein
MYQILTVHSLYKILQGDCLIYLPKSNFPVLLTEIIPWFYIYISLDSCKSRVTILRINFPVIQKFFEMLNSESYALLYKLLLAIIQTVNNKKI